MNKLSLTGLTKSFAGTPVFTNISFAANKGDVVALLGSSGAGKSTLLRCINQLEIPDKGTIQVNDLCLQFPCKQHRAYRYQVRQLRTQVGMVFQQFNLWPHMTVLGNIMEAPLRVLQQPYEQVKQDAEKLLAQIDLLDKKHAYPLRLSGGQQQRVAIARALIMKPDIMLFDEPTSSLDPEMSREVLSMMRSLVTAGMTILIATHEINFVREVATQLMFLDQGKILEFGPASDLFEQPRTERFRRFLEAEDNVENHD